MFNMHFNKEPGPGTAVCTNIQAGIIFKEPGEEIRHVTGGDNLFITPRDLLIPAGASSHSASREYVFEEAVELLSFMPHMHLRGTAMSLEAILPSGRRQLLSHVGDFNFNWHNSYVYTDDVAPLLPKGTLMKVTAWYDNTAANRSNPDPNVWVGSGSRTADEMGHAWVNVTYFDDEDYEAEVAKREAAEDSGQ